MICIHHNKDLDGYCSGAVVKHKYPDAKLIGWDYADDIPDFEQFKGEDIIMIDITFPIAKIKELAAICNHLTVIDHHISFFKEFKGEYMNGPTDAGNSETSYAHTDMLVENGKLRYVYVSNRAACEIGWQTLFPDQFMPAAVTLLGKYDTWRQGEGDWEGETLPFQYAMRVECTSPETFDYWLFRTRTTTHTDILDRIKVGKSILEYQRQQDMLAAKRSSFEKEVYGGLRGLIINTRFFSSDTLKSKYDPSKHDVLVGFEYTGKKWTVSLRSIKDEVNVSEIAKARGGGGHAKAAGFEVVTFEEIFK